VKVRILKKLLIQHGWAFKRQGKGSHEIWYKDEKTLVVPGANGKEIAFGTLVAILHQAGIPLDALRGL
jgi:mRNA interferase HicA